MRFHPMSLRSVRNRIALTALFGISALIVAGSQASAVEQDVSEYEVGLSKVDMTPDYPIRLSGFAGRLKESDGVRQHIFARAMAIRSHEDQPAVVVAVDSLGVPQYVRDEVAHRLNVKKHLAERPVCRLLNSQPYDANDVESVADAVRPADSARSDASASINTPAS